ncbi:hypothetical protein PW5551_00120 [Petrotoga sp. 9PW.55.5.1]|nr:hypothetical protein PW5551_00120 [Petrotoga sp. 9PW.55.5.1]
MLNLLNSIKLQSLQLNIINFFPSLRIIYKDKYEEVNKNLTPKMNKSLKRNINYIRGIITEAP